MPPLRWQTCLFITLNAVILSMLLFDAPIGASEAPAPVKHLGEMLTGFGDSAWLIYTSILLFFRAGRVTSLSRRRVPRRRRFMSAGSAPISSPRSSSQDFSPIC